ncbi:Late embryogenesis abundant protein [Sesbania bispinosa]|nr:Late embryogenesis abundant protein [Sesbania bispinosa]
MTKECDHHEDEHRPAPPPHIRRNPRLHHPHTLHNFPNLDHPPTHKPRFILQGRHVFSFNLSSTGDTPSPNHLPPPNTLTLSMQVTLSALNPNSRIGIYYQKLDAYASYRGQQISLATELPPTYQGHRDVSVWSPLLFGNGRASVAVRAGYSEAGPDFRGSSGQR